MVACSLGLAGTASATELAPEQAPTQSDHEAHHVDTIAISYSGLRFVPSVIADPGAVLIDENGSATLTVREDELVVPLFGARYWINDTLGFDLSLGVSHETGDEERDVPNPDPALSTTSTRSTPSTTAFAMRFAVPLSLYSYSHFNFLLIPEIDIGYANATEKAYEASVTGEALDLRLTGFGLGLGARLGGELSFGFIDVPGLALEAAWGVRFESSRRRGAIGDADHRLNSTAVGTSWKREPGRIVVGGLALRYYL